VEVGEKIPGQEKGNCGQTGRMTGLAVGKAHTRSQSTHNRGEGQKKKSWRKKRGSRNIEIERGKKNVRKS